MSECNFCAYEGYKRRQLESPSLKILTLRQEKHGLSLYKHFPDIDIESLTKRQRFKYHVATFGAIPAQCECD